MTNAVVELDSIRQKHATISGGLVMIAQDDDCCSVALSWSSLHQWMVKVSVEQHDIDIAP